MPASYDENGAYIGPEVFDSVSGEWKVGFEDQRTEWEQQFKEAYRAFGFQRGVRVGSRVQSTPPASRSTRMR